MTDYSLLCEQLQSLAGEERHWLPLLSNASALLFGALEEINWAGFYLKEGGDLLLGYGYNDECDAVVVLNNGLSS